jgi:hypothetical protein
VAAGTIVLRDLVSRVQDTLDARGDDAATAARVFEWYRALGPANGAAA